MRTPYAIPLTAEEVHARGTMPTTAEGHIVALTHLDHPRPEYIQAWRTWCRAHPRHLWPKWIETWSLTQKFRRA
jgi:hypothetical protein